MLERVQQRDDEASAMLVGDAARRVSHFPHHFVHFTFASTAIEVLCCGIWARRPLAVEVYVPSRIVW